MVIVAVYGNETEGKKLVFRERPLVSPGETVTFRGDGPAVAAVVLEVRPEPTYGWEMVIKGACAARAGWVLETGR